MNRKGFTLVELLIVIAIIGVLASVILLSVNSARAKARDSRRKEDFHQMIVGLELYYNQYGGYPATGTLSATDTANYANTNYGWDGKANAWTNLFDPLVTAGYMPSIVRDPLNVASGQYPWSTNNGVNLSTNNLYHYRSNGTAGAGNATHYLLCTWLENHSDPLTLQYTDLNDPFSPSLKLLADDGYSKYNYCVTETNSS